MRGDVVLFKSGGGLFDQLIMWATKGPYTHVEIDLGNGLFVGEHSSGVVVHKPEPGRSVELFRPKGNLEAGLAWVGEVIAENKASRGEAHEYGFIDIAAEAFRVLGMKMNLRSAGAWDCSDFVTRYLIVAGAAGPLGRQASDPGMVSPNDIARAYGIIKQ